MKQFSLGNAWSAGMSFFSGQGINHAVILIGMGILLPFVLQVILVGQGLGMMGPAMMGEDGMQALAAAGGAFLLVTLVSYILQIGSYFGSWRLGFGQGETLAGAIVYGLIAAVMVVVGIIILVLVVGLVGGIATQGGGGGADIGVGVVVALLVLIPLLVLMAIMAPLLVAVMCVILFLITLIALAFGASALGQNPTFSMFGGGLVAFIIILGIAVLLFWLTARLCCTTSAMARHKSYNIIGAMGESWRLTAADQGRIMLYFFLLGIVGMVIFFIVAMVVGASMMGSLQTGSVPEVGIASMIIGTLVGIPIAYAMVLVPAGIYRELGDFNESAKVFT